MTVRGPLGPQRALVWGLPGHLPSQSSAQAFALSSPSCPWHPQPRLHGFFRAARDTCCGLPSPGLCPLAPSTQPPGLSCPGAASPACPAPPAPQPSLNLHLAMEMPSPPHPPWGPASSPHQIFSSPYLRTMYEVRDWPSLGDIQRASWRKGLARSNTGRECAGKRWHSSSSLSVQLQGRFFLPTPSLHLRAQPSPSGCPKSGGLNSWRQAQGLDLRAKWLAVPGPVCTSRLPWPLSHCSPCGSCLLGFFLLASQWKSGRACSLWEDLGLEVSSPCPSALGHTPPVLVSAGLLLPAPGGSWERPSPKRLPDSPLPPAQAAEGQVCTVTSVPAPI